MFCQCDQRRGETVRRLLCRQHDVGQTQLGESRRRLSGGPQRHDDVGQTEVGTSRRRLSGSPQRQAQPTAARLR